MTMSMHPGLEGLVDLACRDGVDIRPTLLRVLTDLYVQKPTHTAEEERHYVELAQRLIETVDASTRAIVLARLASYRHIPQALRHLVDSEPLPEPRATGPDTVLDVPAAETPPLAPSRMMQATAAELCDLFFDSDAHTRRLILTNLDAVASGPVTARKSDIGRHLEIAALRHDGTAFARELADALDLDRALAQRIVDDATGEPIVVVAKVLGMPAEVLQRVLLFLNPSVGQSVQRVYELAALYEQMSLQAAHHLLSILRDATAQPAHRSVTYQPTSWNDEQIGAREAAMPHHHHEGGRDSEVASAVKIGAR